ncbi:MAG: hypothetical protein FJW36_22485 [Acidobacteria bacterium]|nr:hypothetical protein [Acidobacteriota bacterium]
MKTFFLALSLAASLSAASIPLFNTGTDASNNQLPTPGALETHFNLIPPTGSVNAFLTRWQFPYIDETSLGARWISPAIITPTAPPSFPNGGFSFILEQTFDMSPFDISTASLSGLMGADNCMIIRLNTTVLATTGGSCPATRPSFNFTTLTPFSATASAFIAGINTLQLQYSNAGGPGALVVTDL